MKQKTAEELIKEMDPKELAAGLCRAEAEDPKLRHIYRKGAKSMLQNFIRDADFVAAVMDEFDAIYENDVG